MPRQKGGQKSFSAVCKCVYYQFSIAAASRLVTVVMSDPGPRLPSRMRLSGSEHAVVYRHGRDKDLFSALIFNTIFVAVSTACLLIGAAMVVNANLGTKWLHCVSRLGPSLLAHRGHTQLLASRAANEGSRRSRKALQSKRRPLLGPSPD